MGDMQNVVTKFKQGQTLSLLWEFFFLIPFISQFTTNCKFKGQLSKGRYSIHFIFIFYRCLQPSLCPVACAQPILFVSQIITEFTDVLTLCPLLHQLYISPSLAQHLELLIHTVAALS